VKSIEIAEDAALLAQIRLDPKRQPVGSQCSGTLLLAKLGLLKGSPACTDLNTKKWSSRLACR
jgi:transcriptional regulator GlxA family with amidase domain